MVSMLHVEPLFRNLDGMSSRKYNKYPPPLEFLSNHIDHKGCKIQNCAKVQKLSL